MSNVYMYRTQIIDYPEFEEYIAFDDSPKISGGQRERIKWHRPVGWTASPDYIEHYKTDKFFEPSINRWYKSRSSAADRARLLNSMGYTAIAQRSAPIVWPSGAATRVETSESQEVMEAIRVLKRAGLIKSADDLIK